MEIILYIIMIIWYKLNLSFICLMLLFLSSIGMILIIVYIFQLDASIVAINLLVNHLKLLLFFYLNLVISSILSMDVADVAEDNEHEKNQETAKTTHIHEYLLSCLSFEHIPRDDYRLVVWWNPVVESEFSVSIIIRIGNNKYTFINIDRIYFVHFNLFVTFYYRFSSFVSIFTFINENVHLCFLS